jgi:hypothetical protein
MKALVHSNLATVSPGSLDLKAVQLSDSLTERVLQLSSFGDSDAVIKSFRYAHGA